MNADLYAAWLTAGDRLQPAGDWLLANWPMLAIAVTAVVVIWRTWRIRPRDDYRSRNDRVAAQRIARTEARPEPGQPGIDQQLLDACRAIAHASETSRKEKPQP